MISGFPRPPALMISIRFLAVKLRLESVGVFETHIYLLAVESEDQYLRFAMP
jgi:hypothetical protein